MKSKIVPSSELSAKRGLRAKDYIEKDKPITAKDKPITAREWAGLQKVIYRCFDTAKSKGWWDKYTKLARECPSVYKELMPEIVASKLMLQVSELAEALEEVRVDSDLTHIYYTAEVDGKKMKSDSYSMVKKWLRGNGHPVKEPKPEGLPIEIADCAIRIFDFCGGFGIDLMHAIRIKMDFNMGRPHLHGGKKL